ncbi:MAG TPA: large-conductance mechanosensitive channel protein MscL [Thermoanaerobaculia bacterium]|nr:large-conductance mechanosensitive channel protein MscL [Thermoanaerobaculia bacterium]
MGMVKEFREFAIKGNVIDLAVAVVIGAAFGKIVSSFVDDILMPPLGILVGKHDFSQYFVTLSPGHYESVQLAKAAGAATLNYGLFINTIINFLIVAVAMFIVVRWMNKLARKPAEKATPNMRDCPECLSAIPVNARRCKFCSVVVTPTASPA